MPGLEAVCRVSFDTFIPLMSKPIKPKPFVCNSPMLTIGYAGFPVRLHEKLQCETLELKIYKSAYKCCHCPSEASFSQTDSYEEGVQPSDCISVFALPFCCCGPLEMLMGPELDLYLLPEDKGIKIAGIRKGERGK